MNTLITPRLLLRPLERRDLRALHDLFSDDEVMRYITGRPRTPRQTGARLRKDLAHHRRFGFGLCLAEMRSTGAPVGRFGLEPHPTPTGLEGELAWMLARRFRGLGLATEAGAALIAWGRDELRLSRIFAETHPDNHASIRVMERLGMSIVETGAERLVYVAPRAGTA